MTVGVPAEQTDRLEFAAFVADRSRTLLRSAYALTGDRAAAEDLVQDTFVRLYPKWDRVRAADNPLAYVRRTLVNRFVNDRRRPSRREFAADVLPEVVDGRDAPSLIDDRDLIWHLLAGLPGRQRAVLVLRYLHDLNDAEIARTLGCREGTVRSLVSRGLASLRSGSETR